MEKRQKPLSFHIWVVNFPIAVIVAAIAALDICQGKYPLGGFLVGMALINAVLGIIIFRQSREYDRIMEGK